MTNRARLQSESHFVGRIGWLRAAVLGANDGISRRRASLSVSLRPAPSPKIFSWQELLGWSPARCQWPQANTFP